MAKTSSEVSSSEPSLRAYGKYLAMYVLGTFLLDLLTVSLLLGLTYGFLSALSLLPTPERVGSVLKYGKSAIIALGYAYGLAVLVAAAVRHRQYLSQKTTSSAQSRPVAAVDGVQVGKDD
jgi:hypothetical protein